MNLLEQYLSRTKTNEVEAMNRLQDAGIVSDNCVMAADVAAEDCQKAVLYLSGEPV